MNGANKTASTLSKDSKQLQPKCLKGCEVSNHCETSGPLDSYAYIFKLRLHAYVNPLPHCSHTTTAI